MVGSHHQVDLEQPQYTVLVEICNDMLCFAIIENYKDYLKYNLQMLTDAFVASHKAKVEEKKPAAPAPSAEVPKKEAEKKKEEESDELRLI